MTTAPPTLTRDDRPRLALGWAALASSLGWLAACADGPPQPALGPFVARAPIVNGRPERGREYVGVVIQPKDGSLCTATLISEHVVLTAKHCVQAADAEQPVAAADLTVGFGDLDDLQRAAVHSVRATPGKYTIGKLGAQDLVGNDLALIRLRESTGVTPLPVLLTSPRDQEGKRAIAVGYGETLVHGPGTKYSVATRVASVSDRTIEVVGTVCQGDSGGPLISEDDWLFGVVSFGSQEECTDNASSSFYQRVDVWADLIREVVVEAGDCEDATLSVCQREDEGCDDTTQRDCARSEEPGPEPGPDDGRGERGNGACSLQPHSQPDASIAFGLAGLALALAGRRRRRR